MFSCIGMARGGGMQPFLVLLTVGALLLGACGGMRPEIQAPDPAPPPPPEPPPVLSAGASTSTSYTAQWAAPDAELVIAGYQLRWRRAGDTDWTEVADIAATVTEYTIPDLDAGTTYEVQVRARYADGEGDWSPVVTVQTAPPPPVLATGDATPTSVTVTWTAPDTELVISGYQLRWRRAGDTDWTEAAEIAGTLTEYTIADLDAGTTYEVQVRARYADGGGEWSLIAFVETTKPPPPPPAPRIPPRTPPIFRVPMVTLTSATVEWTATDTAITHYDVGWKGFLVRGAYEQVRVSATDATYTIDLTGGCHCIVRVRAVTGDVAGEWFYLAVRTRGGYSPTSGPRISIITEDAVYDERDGAIEFILTPQDPVTEALIVSLDVAAEGTASLVQREGTYQVRVGVGSTRVRFRVGLEVDSVDEPDGFVYARIQAPHESGSVYNYDVGDVTSAIVRVRDDD